MRTYTHEVRPVSMEPPAGGGLHWTPTPTGRYAVVPRAGGAARLSPLFNRHRHVVGRMYLCGDGHAWYPTIPRRL
jgi:hypothetical protein